MIVAIDGPAGAGKSSVASALVASSRLSLSRHGGDVPRAHLARARAWHSARRRHGLQLLAAEHPVEFGDDGRVSIAGWDVTERIREPVIDASVPVVARHPEVREVMRERQRALAEHGDSVIEGRDIGVVVAPHADGEGVARRRSRGTRAAQARRARRHRRGRAGRRAAAARRAGRAQHASGAGCRRGGHDEPHARPGDLEDRGLVRERVTWTSDSRSCGAGRVSGPLADPTSADRRTT